MPLMLNDAILTRQPLNSEAGTATASSSRVGILHLEGCTAERFDEIDYTSGDEIMADWVYDKPHPVGFADQVIALCIIGQIEFVLEARASAAFDR